MNTKLIQSKAKYILSSRLHFLALVRSSAHAYFLACWTSGATGTTDARLTHGAGLGQGPGADDPGQGPGADDIGQGPGADGLVRARGVDAPDRGLGRARGVDALDRDHGRAHDQGGGEGAHLPGDAAAAAAPAADHAGTTQSQHN